MSEILSVHLYPLQSEVLLLMKDHNQISFVPSFLIPFARLLPSIWKLKFHQMIGKSSPLCDVILFATNGAAGFVVNVHIKYSFDDGSFNVLVDHPNASGI